MKKYPTMALCYDFDETLAIGNMQEYGCLDDLGVDASAFWEKSNRLAKENQMDKISSYMYLILEQARQKNIDLTRKTIRNWGKNIQLYSGVEDWFKRTTDYALKKGVRLKHYIISSGLKEIIEGTSIARHFEQIFASSFLYDEHNHPIWPAVVLNYTSKTQFLFRVNKGCEDITDDKTINKLVQPNERAMPFSRMIYIGDGETDVPCMRIVKEQGGHAIAVYNEKKKTAKSIAKHLAQENRVNTILPADYSAGSALERYVQSLIDKAAADVAVYNNETRFLKGKF